jgi:hypothetical protein
MTIATTQKIASNSEWLISFTIMTIFVRRECSVQIRVEHRALRVDARSKIDELALPMPSAMKLTPGSMPD